jgi:predicted transcriptional regulator
MTVADIKRILKAEVYCGQDKMDKEVRTACGSDMMSDVLAFVKDQSVLLTGLVNSQVIRTAEMMDMVCIVFVRGKTPSAEMLELAEERDLVVMSSGYRMFTACGLLYDGGLKGGCETE